MFFMFSLPKVFHILENKYYIAVSLALEGITLSGTFTPTYLIMEQISLAKGFCYGTDSLRLITGIWINFAMSGSESSVCWLKK